MEFKIWLAIKGHCKAEDNYYLSKFDKIWFTSKIIFAIIFHRKFKYNYKYDTVTVSAFNGHTIFTMDGTEHEWEELIVLKKGFKYALITNGT